MERWKDSTNEVSWRETFVKMTLVSLAIVAVVSFVTYFISRNYYEPLNGDQFDQLEEVAREVYAAQKENNELEVPKDFLIEDVSSGEYANTTAVQYADKKYQGRVIAEMKNGELVMTRDTTIMKNSCIINGCYAAIVVSILLIVIICKL